MGRTPLRQKRWAIIVDLETADDQLVGSMMRRISGLVDAERTLVSCEPSQATAMAHRLARWPEVTTVPAPRHRGSLPRIVLALLRIQARDPLATVLIMPASWGDGGVMGPDEGDLVSTLYRGSRWVVAHPDEIVLYGWSPADPPERSSWIHPRHVEGDAFAAVDSLGVGLSPLEARRQQREGALAVTGIMAAPAVALSRLAFSYRPDWWTALAQGQHDRHALKQAFHSLPASDLCRDVLVHSTRTLRVGPLHPGPDRIGSRLHRSSSPGALAH